MLDWQRRGIGRIARASGTHDPKVYRGIVDMLGSLYGSAQFSTLKAIYAGKLHPLEVYARYKKGQSVEDADAVALLSPRVEKWLENYTGRTRNNYRSGLNRLMRHGPRNVTLAQLPELARLDKTASQKAGEAPSFNRGKAYAQTFAAETLGRSSPIYQALYDIKNLPETRKERMRLSVQRALEVRRRLPMPLSEVWWHLCLTGMIASEYVGQWECREDGTEIWGGKAAGRHRIVPRLATIERVTFNRRDFAATLTALGVESYDARRAFIQWMDSAEIPRSRRRIYAGHGPKDTTDLYEMGELSAFRSEDGRLMRAWLKRQMSIKSPKGSAKLSVAR